MDHGWAIATLTSFANSCQLILEAPSQYRDSVDNALQLEPVVQRIMNFYESGLGDYEPDHSSVYVRWSWPRECAMRAIGIAQNYEQLQQHLKPDAPYIAADGLHEWVWTAAQPLWEADAPREAVFAATRVINARIQQKSGRSDISEADLAMQVLDSTDPQPGKPRLFLPGDRTKPSWKSQQEGMRFFAAGCFRAIRNPAAHEESVRWSKQEALEYLAALSALARWLETCTTEEAKAN